MNDDQIIQLYFDRSEQAIKETDTKYGGYCYSIAYNILTNPEDAEESVSDTYLSAWNAMPPSSVSCAYSRLRIRNSMDLTLLTVKPDFSAISSVESRYQ